MDSRLDRVFAAAIFVFALLGMAAGAMAQTKPVPLINQPLVPDAVAPGGPAFTLTVNGTGFVNKSVVEWNGNKRITTVVSHSQLTATISAKDIATAGTASVTVVNPAPTGGRSNGVFLSITNSTTNVGFQLGSSPVTGKGPDSVAVGDFNGDGKLDLAVANGSSDTVSILLGDGTGNFTLASSPTVGVFPYSVAVGDFNGDGKLDLAVANLDDDTVSILLGDGTGNFTLVSSPATGAQPMSVAVGDFNGDGKLDLAVANYRSGTISILLGDGTGNFTLESTPQCGNYPLSVAAGDFNGDGNLDLAVINNDDNTVSVLLGDGEGNFTLNSAQQVGERPWSVTVADFNGDGKLDLAVANNNTVSILLGDGTGNFTTMASSPNYGGQFITTGDFNGDGKVDLAVTGDNAVSILLGDGQGNFALSASPPTGNQPFSIAVGDFNEDGKLDFATANGGDATVSILLQTPAVSLVPGSLNFGGLQVGMTSAPQIITVTNVGYAAVDLTGITIAGFDPQDYTQTNNCPSSLAVGASCMITVTFAPQEGDALYATLSISGDGGFNPSSISLNGTGLAIELSATSLNFGDEKVGQTSPPLSSTVTNLGSTTVLIGKIIIKGTDPEDFSESNTCPKHLHGGNSCKITVTFTPRKTGSRTANVNIQDDGGDSPQKISLSGTGT